MAKKQTKTVKGTKAAKATKPARKGAVKATAKKARGVNYVTREELEQAFGGLMTLRTIERRQARQEAVEDVDAIIAGNIFARAIGGAVGSLVAMGMDDPKAVAVMAVDFADAVLDEVAKRVDEREAKDRLANDPNTTGEANVPRTSVETEDEEPIGCLGDNEPDEAGYGL